MKLVQYRRNLCQVRQADLSAGLSAEKLLRFRNGARARTRIGIGNMVPFTVSPQLPHTKREQICRNRAIWYQDFVFNFVL